MLKLTDTREQYQIRQSRIWEERLILRLRQIMRGCQKAEFVLSIDGQSITIRRLGKTEIIE